MSAGDSRWLLAGLFLYLGAVLVVGFITWRRMRSLDDFVLGGRRLSPFTAALSERASGESAWFLLGLPGAAYAAGFREFWAVIGIAFGVFASWALLARLLNSECRRLGALTLPDFFEAKFGSSTENLDYSVFRRRPVPAWAHRLRNRRQNARATRISRPRIRRVLARLRRSRRHSIFVAATHTSSATTGTSFSESAPD